MSFFEMPSAGGQDLVFPHHENEIAQSQAAAFGCEDESHLHDGQDFVRYWVRPTVASSLVFGDSPWVISQPSISGSQRFRKCRQREDEQVVGELFYYP